MIARARHAAALAALACLSSCLALRGGFECESSDQCTSDEGPGVCEPTRYCSFTDPTCPSSRRYGEHASSELRNTCVAPGPAAQIIAADRITGWRPGIIEDGQLKLPLGDDGLPRRTKVCSTIAPGQDIQQAIDGCPEGQVVALGPGTFTVTSTISLTRGVVLRGAGSQGAPGGTTIVKSGGGTVLAVGTGRSSVCYDDTGYGSAHALTRIANRGTTVIEVGAAAADFSAGGMALVDEADDSAVHQGSCNYFKRVSGRSVSQRVEIRSVNSARGTVTLSSPLHWSFRPASPHLARLVIVEGAITRWAGIEHLRVQGGTNTGYSGEMAGGVEMSNAAYCWLKDVQTDGTIGGVHVALNGAYRCVVRDSYVHHSASYGYDRDCFGIVLRCGAADNLVENNIVRYMNKPILFTASGGGNVVGYNYVDNSWSSPATHQELNIDCLCSFPHMELVEGNLAPHVGASNGHGNAGYLTFYRNHASSQFAPPAVYGSTAVQTESVTAIHLQGGHVNMNVVGNVLGTSGVSSVYETYGSSVKSIYEFDGGAGSGDVVVRSLYRHGNYDHVNKATIWSPDNPVHALPASLYYAERPRWWPTGSAWPWVGPDLSPMVGTLPAKARSDQLPP
jgi:hypothetical protein